MGSIEGANPLFDIISQLKEGRNIPPSSVAERGILAPTNTAEGEFYRRLVGQQIADQREKARAIQADAGRNAAVEAASSNVPAKAAPISDTYDLSNAPASQQAPQNKDQNMARTMIGNVLRSPGSLMKHDKAAKAKEKAATYKKEGSDEAKSERKDGKMPKELLEHFKNKSKKK